MANAERFAVLVIVCGIALALLTSLIIFACCQLIYKLNKSRHRSRDCHRTVLFEHQTTTSENENGELFSYCFEESTSAQQGESEAQDSPSPDHIVPTSTTKTVTIREDHNRTADPIKSQKHQSINCNNNAPVIPTSTTYTSTNATTAAIVVVGVPSSAVVATTTATAGPASVTSSNSGSFHHVPYHNKRIELTQVDSCISQTSSTGSGSSSSLISSSSRLQPQQQQQHHHHHRERLFTKQQEHRSKRFGRSATLSHTGSPADETIPSIGQHHHHRHGHHHHVAFASTSLEVLGADPCDPAATGSGTASASRNPREQCPPAEAKDNVIEIESSCSSPASNLGERKSREASATLASSQETTTSNAPAASASVPAALIGILRQTSVDVPDPDVTKTLTINPLLSVKGESVDSSASERSPETIKKQYQELWQLRAEFEEEEKEKRSISHDEEERGGERMACGSSSSIQLSASIDSHRSGDGRTDRPSDSSVCKSLMDERKDYSIDQTSEKIYRQFATPSSGTGCSGGVGVAALKPASAHPSIEEEDEEEEDDSEVVIFV